MTGLYCLQQEDPWLMLFSGPVKDRKGYHVVPVGDKETRIFWPLLFLRDCSSRSSRSGRKGAIGWWQCGISVSRDVPCWCHNRAKPGPALCWLSLWQPGHSVPSQPCEITIMGSWVCQPMAAIPWHWATSLLSLACCKPLCHLKLSLHHKPKL